MPKTKTGSVGKHIAGNDSPVKFIAQIGLILGPTITALPLSAQESADTKLQDITYQEIINNNTRPTEERTWKIPDR